MDKLTFSFSSLLNAGILLALVSCAPLTSGTVRKSWQGTTSPINKALSSLVEAENIDVSIAPIVNKITLLDRGLSSRKEVDAWEYAMRNHVIADMEQNLLNLNISGVRVVDRNTIETVLSQQKFNMALSNDERIELGKLMGATHLIMIDITRGSDSTWSGEKIFKDTFSLRLIDVGSGEVLGSQSSTYPVH